MTHSGLALSVGLLTGHTLHNESIKSHQVVPENIAGSSNCPRVFIFNSCTGHDVHMYIVVLRYLKVPVLTHELPFAQMARASDS